MSLPARREPRRASTKWDAIHYALDSNARTFRLCLILLVAGVALSVIPVLLQHLLALL